MTERQIFLSEWNNKLERTEGLLGMSSKFFRLNKLGFHFFRDKQSEYSDYAYHNRQIAQANQSKNGSVPEGDSDSTAKHWYRVNDLADFLANTFTNGLEILCNLRGHRFDLLLLEELCFLLQQWAKIERS